MGQITSLAMPDNNLIMQFAQQAPQIGQAFDQALQASRQQQLARYQLGQQLQQAQQLKAAQQAYISNPNAQNLNTLITLDPKSATAIKSGHDALDLDTQKSQLRQATYIRGLIASGDTDGALKALQQRIDADKAAGHDTTDDQHMAELIQADPKQAGAAIDYHLAAILGPEKWAENFKAPGEAAAKAADLRKANAEARKAQFIPVKNDMGGEDLINIGDGSAPAPAAAPPGNAAGVRQASTGGPQPRGVRNNNPVNVTNLGGDQKWDGQTGSDGSYAVFATPEAGMAAADKNLQAYGTKHGINTIAGVIQRWAPPNENDTGAYTATVAKAMGVDPNQKINLKNPNTRKALLAAMSTVELGQPGAAGAMAGSSGDDALAATDQSQLGPGVSVAYKSGGAGGGDAVLDPEQVALIGQQYLSMGPSALTGMGVGKISQINRKKVLAWVTDTARAAGTSNPALVARFAQNKANVEALGQNTKTLTALSGSLHTLDANIDLANQLAAKGVGPTGVPMLDTPINKLRMTLGSSDAKTLDNVLRGVAAEQAKLLTTSTGAGGGATSDSARNEGHEMINSGMTLRQIIDAGNAMKAEGQNRVSSVAAENARLNSEISGVPQPAPAAGHGGATPPTMTPQLQAAMAYKGNDHIQVGMQQNPYLPKTQAQYNHLPPKAWFIDTDGAVVQKGVGGH